TEERSACGGVLLHVGELDLDVGGVAGDGVDELDGADAGAVDDDAGLPRGAGDLGDERGSVAAGGACLDDLGQAVPVCGSGPLCAQGVPGTVWGGVQADPGSRWSRDAGGAG